MFGLNFKKNKQTKNKKSIFSFNSKKQIEDNPARKQIGYLDEDLIISEINRFKVSHRRRLMITGENYYEGKHDILNAVRTAIGENGELTEIDNLPNNRVVDNQYKKMVDQKANYLVGQPITFQTENEQYSKELKNIFNKKFMRTIKAIGEDSLNMGIAWLYPYYDETGKFTFKVFKSYECIPKWKDAEHTELVEFLRIYEAVVTNGAQEIIIEKVEVYTKMGVYYFILEGNNLTPDKIPFKPHFLCVDNKDNEKSYNWAKIPVIPFKYNRKELPLIRMVKSLQDGINKILSNFENNMDEDVRNTILVLVNYDGENLGQFRRNLATYGAIKVNNIDGKAGDVKTLKVEVNAENYKAILEIFKKAIIENAMGYDAKDDRLSGNANQLNIQSMYSDIDLDANNMETEFQASFEDLLWFVNCHLANIGAGDFENEELEVIFNRDMLMNEAEIIQNINNSSEILSEETLVANHPWVDDLQKELQRKEAEKQKNIEQYGNAFNPQQNSNNSAFKNGENLNEE